MITWKKALEWREEQRRRFEDDVRTLLRGALEDLCPGGVVWIYGSLAKPGRFRHCSDADVAFETLPAGLTLEYLQSVLTERTGVEVDVCLLERTRLREEIQRTGERWIL